MTPPPRQRRFSGIPPGIWALGFVSLLMDVSSELIHSLLPLFLVDALGATALAVGLIEGLAEATALVVKMFSGALSDYWGKRKSLAVLGYGLAALTKPLFALAPAVGMVLAARLLDRVGKGIRGAPRDALVADITSPEARGAAFGLRQALDTAGAFLGPLLAVGLMLWWADNFRAVFWFACIPAALAVVVLVMGVREPERRADAKRANPIRRENLKRLSRAYWQVVGVGAVFTLASLQRGVSGAARPAKRYAHRAGAAGHGGDESGVRGGGLSVRQTLRPHEPQDAARAGPGRTDRRRSGAGRQRTLADGVGGCGPVGAVPGHDAGAALGDGGRRRPRGFARHGVWRIPWPAALPC